MCTFISDKHVMPGFICCVCRGYNGLQRDQCNYCGWVTCDTLVIPPEVNRCPSCGWGWIGKRNWTVNGDGTPVSKDHCLCCGNDLRRAATKN